MGTGNFNGDTARVYTDHSLLTTDPRITEEAEKLFMFYSDNLKTGTYKHLLVSPFTMRKNVTALINKEIANARKNIPAAITLKLNNLVDPNIIKKLYETSTEGVKIKLLVRGICSLVAGVRGLSDNIEEISIVDKFLEHSRVFIFHNGGNEKIYLSSADWMARNLDHRSEVAVPVYDKNIQLQVKQIMDILWADNTKARVLGSMQNNEYRRSADKTEIRAQEEIYKYFKLKKK